MIRAIAIDLAMANMGLARVEIEARSRAYGVYGVNIRCLDLRLVTTERENKKEVRKSSDNYRRARELYSAMNEYVRDAQYAFVEIPHGGGQSAAAVASLSLAVGVLASLPIPVIEVSPTEVKEIVSGRRTGKQPSKAEMIAWAVKRFPNAPWLRYERDGKAGKDGKVSKTTGSVSKAVSWKAGDLRNDNEHLADAIIAVEAGVRTPEFQRILALGPIEQTAVIPRRRASFD